MIKFFVIAFVTLVCRYAFAGPCEAVVRGGAAAANLQPLGALLVDTKKSEVHLFNNTVRVSSSLHITLLQMIAAPDHQITLDTSAMMPSADQTEMIAKMIDSFNRQLAPLIPEISITFFSLAPNTSNVLMVNVWPDPYKGLRNRLKQFQYRRFVAFAELVDETGKPFLGGDAQGNLKLIGGFRAALKRQDTPMPPFEVDLSSRQVLFPRSFESLFGLAIDPLLNNVSVDGNLIFESDGLWANLMLEFQQRPNKTLTFDEVFEMVRLWRPTASFQDREQYLAKMISTARAKNGFFEKLRMNQLQQILFIEQNGDYWDYEDKEFKINLSSQILKQGRKTFALTPLETYFLYTIFKHADTKVSFSDLKREFRTGVSWTYGRSANFAQLISERISDLREKTGSNLAKIYINYQESYVLYSSQPKFIFGELQAFEFNPALQSNRQSIAINPQIHRLILNLIGTNNVALPYSRVAEILRTPNWGEAKYPSATKKKVNELIDRHNAKMQASSFPAALIEKQERNGEAFYQLPFH